MGPSELSEDASQRKTASSPVAMVVISLQVWPSSSEYCKVMLTTNMLSVALTVMGVLGVMKAPSSGSMPKTCGGNVSCSAMADAVFDLRPS